MRILKSIFTLLMVFLLQGSFGQSNFDFSDERVLERLKKDIYTLADERMEGREAGTPGERLAAEYIANQMLEAGLKPIFNESYFQEVPFPGAFVEGPDNFLVIDGVTYTFNEDFFALPNTGNAVVNAPAVFAGFGLEGVEGIDNYGGLGSVAGRVVVLDYYSPEGLNERLDITTREALAQKIELAVKKGAAGIILVNTLSWQSDPRISLGMEVPREGIPVVFGTERVRDVLLAKADVEVLLSTELERPMYTGYNVAGYWDNGAPTTVIIGGHYDHLGYGGSGSRSPGEHALHPGADDNASGTAGVLEAARYLVQSDLKKHNYIFIAFTAEEKGLIGSRYFADSEAYDMGKVNYMFNFDMLGRLTDNKLSLIGTGTTPIWEAAIDHVAPGHFNIRKSPGGLGGSDHTAFYLKNIPVLFFFTGIHDDYHRPGDTPDKVNYQGTLEIMKFTYDLMRELETEDRLAFTPTQSSDTRRRRTEGVTLGLMPDHVYTGEGLKIQAVMDDRPAQKAGIANGDVIIRINDDEVSEIQTYMRALGNLKGGSKAMITVKRGEEVMTFQVQL
ncbi:MAG: M20/M25/M40 family metallo-hydrolase [Bacteroidales bacterium]|jgi:hypothetical protein|nr:M20/M25/M40 family metallo-hydrolase [Bacteroidales bacterium]NLM92376.1 M20/M25/M40 family metallo-hydrolase [Bacteroidales bacterium]